ncbi:hypothetical protein INT47_001705 [Mucor saturninus]|uniref:Periplasmic binding protein n=1 Tax=Mucor saturninus TaxID=64648 RepID=A0A8H7V9M7_9FUNG|nr:hypothetical protein INT47_001705 [Mucor saturninus]
MRTIGFLAISTFLLNSVATVAAVAAEFRSGEDIREYINIDIFLATLSGFTIEYKNYYKVVTNIITGQKYCLVGWNQVRPEDCPQDSSFNVPIQEFNFDTDSYHAIPYIELLGIQTKLSGSVSIQNITSPCILDGSQNTKITSPQMVLSLRSVGLPYVSFSGNDDSLGPLEKASWLLYLGVFFDMESEALLAYNQIANNYNCHKRNLQRVNKNKIVSWTSFDPIKKTYTINGDNYYTQLSSDAGAVLRSPNRLQDNTYNTAVFTELHALALQLQGAEFIFDISDTSVDYNTWYKSGGVYFTPNNSFAHVPAIADSQVYSTHGLVNSNGISDWTQRSAARPDLALLDIVELLYPTFAVPDASEFPVWFTRFDKKEQRLINESYGNCSSIITSAAKETACTIGTDGGSHTRTLTSGGKAGVSVGVIIFVFLAAGLGLWLFRRYRRNKRHNFYRMNEL